MDKIEKALQRLRPAERKKIKDILIRLKNHDFKNLDLKKLKGREDIFRIRQGKIRIIYRVDSKDNIFILALQRRNDATYKF